MSSTDPDRDRIEQLLARAERVVHQPVPTRGPSANRRWVIAGAGLVAVIVLVAALVSGGHDAGPAQTTAVPLAATTAFVPTTIPIVITLPPNPTSASSTSTSAVSTTLPTSVGLPPRSMSYEAGKIVLRGSVPDQSTGDALFFAMAGGFGAGNVVAQYTIDAEASLTDADPLAANDAVRFPAGQPVTEIQSLPFLLSVAHILVLHPTATLEIHVSADGGGDALARQRAAVIGQYLAAQGVAPQRLTSAGDPASGLNAQVTLVFHHLVG